MQFGIYYNKQTRKFQARFRLRTGALFHIGTFRRRTDATVARNVFFHELFGSNGLLLAWQSGRKRRKKNVNRKSLEELQRLYVYEPKEDEHLLPPTVGEVASVPQRSSMESILKTLDGRKGKEQ